MLIEVAKAYWLGQQSQLKIAKRYGVDRATVARWLESCVSSGIISFVIDSESVAEYTLDKERARQLRDTFGLKDCTVVRIPELESRGSTAASESDDTALHTTLATAAGREAATRIAAGDAIGLAGGRTICRLARVLGKNPEHRDLSFIALAGRMWVESLHVSRRQELFMRPLDADDAAAILGEAYESQPGTTFRLTCHPLYASTSAEAEAIRKLHGGWNLPEAPVNRAYVGIGVLDPQAGHRMMGYLEAAGAGGQKNRSTYIDRALEPLKAISEITRKRRLPFVGDIANRIYPVLPLPSELADAGARQKQQSAYREIVPHIDALNDRAIVVDWDQLRAVRNVRAIAGGNQKRWAIWTALLPSLLFPDRKAVVTELTTDSKCADLLIDAAYKITAEDPDEARSSRAAELQQWYRTVIEELGLFESPRGG